MIPIPPDSYDAEVLEIGIGLIDRLACGDVEGFAEESGVSFSFGVSPAECVRSAIASNRSPEWYPGVEYFVVTDWHDAAGGVFLQPGGTGAHDPAMAEPLRNFRGVR